MSLEARAGALASMHSFITACPQLLTEDILRRLLLPIEAALNLLTLLSGEQECLFDTNYRLENFVICD